MWKKWMVGLSVATVLLVGCQKEENVADTKQETTKDRPFTIVVDKKEPIELEDVKDALEEKFDIEVKVEAVSGKKKNEMLYKGEGDLFLLTPNEIGLAQSEGMIQPLTIQKERYLNASVEALQYKAEQYGIPASFDVPLFVYNPLFIEQAPHSFDDLADYQIDTTVIPSEEISKNSMEVIQKIGEDFVYPYLTYVNFAKHQYIDAVARSYGYMPFAKKDGVYNVQHAQVTSDKMEKGFEKIKQLHTDISPKGKLKSKQTIALFEENLLYSLVISNKEIDSIKGDVKVSALPNLEEGIEFQTPMDVKGWAVAKTVENKDIIQEFENIITKEEFVKHQIGNGYYTPVHLEIEQEEERLAAVYEQANRSYSLPIMAESRELTMPIERALEWYLDGKIPLKEALKNAQETIEFEINVNY